MQSRQQLLAREIEKKATTPSVTNTANYQSDTKPTDQQKKTTKTIKQQTVKNGLKVRIVIIILDPVIHIAGLPTQYKTLYYNNTGPCDSYC